MIYITVSYDLCPDFSNIRPPLPGTKRHPLPDQQAYIIVVQLFQLGNKSNQKFCFKKTKKSTVEKVLAIDSL